MKDIINEREPASGGLELFIEKKASKEKQNLTLSM